jgi:hypothetical protein
LRIFLPTLVRAAAGLIVIGPALLAAQTPRAPVILLLPSGPRSLAMGNTGVASRDDEVIFFNPAQLAIANGMSASGEWLSNSAGTGALSAVTRFNGGGIGIGMRMANYEQPAGVFPATRATMLDGGSDAAGSLEASVGMAQTIKGVRAGVVAKYAEDVVGAVRLGRPLADVGLAKDMFRSTVGLAVQNIGRDMNVGTGQIQLPLKTTLGVSHARSVGEFDLGVTGAVSLIRDSFVQPSGGAEVHYSWLSGYDLVVRGGARRAIAGEEPLTAGAGFTMDRLTIDYALETLSNRRVGHRIGLRIR